MFIIKVYFYLVYLLRVLMLAGCNHIIHPDRIGNSVQLNNNRKKSSITTPHQLTKLGKRIDDNIFREALVKCIFNWARKANEESKPVSVPGVKLYRTLMNHIVPEDIAANVPDSLINFFLTHLNAEDKNKYAKRYANTCAHAIADSIINAMQCILLT